MLKNFVKQLLIVTVVCSTFTCGNVHAMEQSPIQETIIVLIKEENFDSLRATLDNLSKYKTQDSIKAHKVLVDYVKTLNHGEIGELFSKLQEESTLKMALRLVYAQKYKVNLGNLDYNYFIENIGRWVNGSGFENTPLLSQDYLQHVLPLIEPLIDAHVTKLNLSHNQLTNLPDTIGNLINLTNLNLCFNQLASLPDTIGNLVNLVKLDLSINKLTSLPDSFGNLSNLVKLNLNFNQLANLPDWIDNLTNLTELDLCSNKLTSLPDSFGNLTNLTELDLSKNKLTSLPDWIGNLVNLTELDLSNNQLTDEMKQKLKTQIGNIETFYI